MDNELFPLEALPTRENISNAAPSSRTTEVLLSALDNKRLPHATLLYGKSLGSQEELAYTLARKILSSSLDPNQHPDFHTLRPSNKMRQISVLKVRELNKEIHHSSNQGGAKVVVIFEPDRMNKEAANAFLKTLEEPPEDTYIFMLTLRPYHLLDTIRSRCFRINVPSKEERQVSEAWQAWMDDFASWLSNLRNPQALRDTSQPIMQLYGLLYRAEKTISTEVDEKWKEQKKLLPDNLEADQVIGIESGLAKEIKQDWFTNIEEVLLSTTGPQTYPNWDILLANPLSQSIKLLEKANGFMGVNLKETQALEYFMLQCLRIWPRYI